MICEANAGSHLPLEDRQARLSGAERANLRAMREYPVTSTTKSLGNTTVSKAFCFAPYAAFLGGLRNLLRKYTEHLGFCTFF